MHDPNMHDFYRRIDRVEMSRARGLGFEAAGTLGRSANRRPRRRRWAILWPMLVLCLALLSLKGIIRHQIGAATYDRRAATLADGSGIDRLGAFVMSTDPVTLWLSGQIARMLR